MAALGMVGTALAALVMLPTAAFAQAPGVEEARELYLDARFTDAVEAFEAMLSRDDVTPAQVAIAHRYLAALGVMLGDEEAAAAHARLAVALRPDVDAPEGAPPEVQALLEAARESTGAEALTLELAPRAPPVAGAPSQFAATVRPPDLPFLPTVRLACESGSHAESAEGAPPELTLELTPEGGAVTCRGSVHSAAGAELVSSLSTFEVGAAEASSGDDAALIGALAGGIGGAVLVAVVVALAVVLSAPQQASFGQPSVEGW